MKFDTDFSYVAPILLYVACMNIPNMYSVRSVFTQSPVRVKRASHGKRCEKIRMKLDPVPRRGFHTYFGTFYHVAEPHYQLFFVLLNIDMLGDEYLDSSITGIAHQFMSHSLTSCVL